MKYVLDHSLTDLAADVLLNATDYIGNRPECFGANHHDMDLLRYCSNFRSLVNTMLTEDQANNELTWDTDSQEQCADYVWALYQKWHNLDL